MNENVKEVFFHKYCETCEHNDVKEYDDPCCECLEAPSNVESHKPVRWKEKE